MVQGEAMEKLLCIKTKTTFPGMALLLFGFLAGMIIPNLVYRFTWKQQAFSAVYLLGTYGRTAAYGKEYLQISNDTGACMSDRVQPSEPVSYIDLIQLSDNVCTVAEHAKESIPFQLTADEFCLVTGVDIYKSNLQEDKK